MTHTIAVAAILIVSLASPQKTERSSREVLAALTSSDARSKAGAAIEIANRSELRKDPALRAAVLTELQKAVEVMKVRQATQTTVGSEPGFEYANVYNGLVHATQRFDGDDVLRALMPTVATSGSSRVRVAAFGSKAIQPLLDLYETPSGTEDPASERLGIMDTLAKVIEGGNVSQADRTRLRALAARSLKSKAPPEIAGGMFVATALHDPGLIDEIRRMRDKKFPGADNTRSPRYLEAMAQKAFDRAGVR